MSLLLFPRDAGIGVDNAEGGEAEEAARKLACSFYSASPFTYAVSSEAYLNKF